MKKFNQFREYLLNILFESRQDLINTGMRSAHAILNDRPSEKVNKIHDKIFGEHNMHIEVPLHDGIPDDVQRHVDTHGDFINKTTNTVKLKSGREVPIQKYLPRTKAAASVVNSYDNYMKKSGSEKTKLVISRKPSEVASASCDTHWHSCADPESGGEAWEKMPDEIHHGTLIAMRVPENAEKNEDGEYDTRHIMGRMLLKRHDSPEGHVIYRPERPYGDFTREAQDATNSFAEHHYPMRDFVYNKHHEVYHDNSRSRIHNMALAKDALDKDAKANNPQLNDYDLESLVKHPDPKVAMAALNHPKSNKYVTRTAASHSDRHVAMAAVEHKSSDIRTLYNGVKNPNQTVAISALYNKQSNGGTINQAAKHPDPKVAMAAMNHPRADFETYEIASKHPNKEVASIASKRLNS